MTSLSRSKQKIQDTSTNSNINEVTTEHFDLDIFINFEEEIIEGIQQLSMKSLKLINGVDLDIFKLDILDVWDHNNDKLNFEVIETPHSDLTGDILRIHFDTQIKKRKVFQLNIKYKTRQGQCSGCFWHKPEFTFSKTQPMLFTQCESIYCRSIAPFQDTPSVKSTYSATVKTLKDVNVFLSADRIDISNDDEYAVYKFEQNIPIPSYLFAIAAGNFESYQISERTFVITEPDLAERAKTELADMEKLLTTIENYLQSPYIWGVYQLVVLPPTFPYGGMENPELTFTGEQLVEGDKIGTDIVIHEMAHSWFGNLITCQNWSNFWLNEGFTNFIEYKTIQILRGQQEYELVGYISQFGMNRTIQAYGDNHTFTSLLPHLGRVHPDVAYSLIPYEKGFTFLAYLESLTGEDMFAFMLHSYLMEFQYKSILYTDFQQFFRDFVIENLDDSDKILSQINWDQWIKEPGYPPVMFDFENDLVYESIQLANDYINENKDLDPSNFYEFSNNQKNIFFRTLKQNRDIQHDVLQRIDSEYNFSDGKDILPSRRGAWFKICILNGYTDNNESLYQFLDTDESISQVSGILSVMGQNNRFQEAYDYYEENKYRYHPSIIETIEG